MKKKHIFDFTIFLCILIMMSIWGYFILFPPIIENGKNYSYGLPEDVSDYCSSITYGVTQGWIECRMSEKSFLLYAKKRKFELKKIESVPMKIGRYTIRKYQDSQSSHPDDNENPESLYHYAKRGYFSKIYYKDEAGREFLKYYIIYDLDNQKYYEEQYLR
jgi:hypothetical protein